MRQGVKIDLKKWMKWCRYHYIHFQVCFSCMQNKLYINEWVVYPIPNSPERSSVQVSPHSPVQVQSQNLRVVLTILLPIELVISMQGILLEMVSCKRVEIVTVLELVSVVRIHFNPSFDVLRYLFGHFRAGMCLMDPFGYISEDRSHTLRVRTVR